MSLSREEVCADAAPSVGGCPEPVDGRIPMDAQEEVRVDEHSFERELNPGVERSAVVPAGVEELEQRLHIPVHHGPAIREPGHS